ncbi:MAG: stealth family protein [Alphaproteobacteria bacterium]|nr:stealth family protein [Alphaproteobacteria bacterium]MCL2889978.1 stealth family protein [Alphaproteobacteria bacterium]
MQQKKIDLVYLWVDGSDPKWRAKKNAALAAMGRPPMKDAVGDNRWMDNGELKYSLRSAEKFVPWINHIYIVTDGQVPKWLDAKNPRVTIIDQNEIIPKKYQPIFNSAALDLFIHKIPGLSEHFIYANDDKFFAKNLSPDYFFDADRNPIVILSLWKQNDALFSQSASEYKKFWNAHDMFNRMIINAVRFIYEKFGKKYHVHMTHSLEPMRKSYRAENVKQFEKYFMDTTATTFRSDANLQKIVFPMMDNAKGRNTIVLNWRAGSRRIIVTPDMSWMRIMYIKAIGGIAKIFGFRRHDIHGGVKNMARDVRITKPAMFNINDNYADFNAFKNAQKFMDEMFSGKSQFEK